LQQGYEVIGAMRRTSTQNFWRLDELGITSQIKFAPFDLHEFGNIQRVLAEYKPELVFNLAAQSFVATSFEQPLLTADADAIGCLRILEAMRLSAPEARFYQASTSEMFGKVRETPQTELTPFHPRSPYGVAKLFAHAITVNYRESYGMHASSGILFNHESPLRGLEFVTRKITSHMAQIKNGRLDLLEVGNLDAERDWGHARDYVRGIYLMSQADKPDDFVLASGRKATVREFVQKAAVVAGFDLVFENTGINEIAVDRKTGNRVVSVSSKFFRPAEVELLIGDPSKAKRKLGWEASTGLEQLVEDMMKADLDRLAQGKALC
jgi:GDPmannose 4,6-dehydratase